MEHIYLPNTPKPLGHYSPGVRHGGFIFVSGQLPMVPGATSHTIGTIEEQTEQALRNVESVLVAAGSSLDKVVQMTVYISDGDLWGRVNAVYAKVMGEHRPARAVVPVKELHYGYQIEIQAIAAGD
ncbi:MAG: RidA family protein [Gemmatimonadetes bacterium]|nr:RidA family protein [Gemmatimonadota bacterium]